ncbi:MAG TPA: hypothetical protein VGF20_08715 [Candidatus Acidoferrum sp.]
MAITFTSAGYRLKFWNPRKMPDACWYSAMYGERNSRVLPLEPGHRFFLADMLAPRCGRLLDVGRGTGNFVRAAWEAGYFASGVELDPAAASFATRYCPRGHILGLPLESFHSQYPTMSSMWLHFSKYIFRSIGTPGRAQRNGVRPALRTRAVRMLGRAKHAACFPIALAALPYVKYRRLAGPYLYCLARKLD